jgi:hypothetical protein
MTWARATKDAPPQLHATKPLDANFKVTLDQFFTKTALAL